MLLLPKDIIPQGAEILSIEAKDLYLSNMIDDKSGYGIRYKKGVCKDELILKKFINTLDYSLDFIYWDKIRTMHIPNDESQYFYNGTHRYTLDFINVTFEYSVKLYNRVGSCFLKNGYSLTDNIVSDIEISGVCIVNDEVVAVDIEKETDDLDSISSYTKYFYYCKDEKKYKAKSNIPTIVSNKELRKWIYENGFVCDKKKYIRFKRSSGSARVGKCLFIDERLYNAMHEYEMMGLNIKEGDEVDLASLEAYISLTLSSIIGIINIDPKSILVIDDYDSIFNEMCIDTTNVDGKLQTNKRTVEISNSIWDGQSLMDISLFDRYKSSGMLLLRNRFFKSCCFNCNIQKWFEDNNITDISQLNGYTLANDIKDVKLITTPSSIKFCKFGTIEQWLNRIESSFGVVKHEKKTHHLNGECVMTHYQLINTLQLSRDDIKNLLKDPLDYIRAIRENPVIMRNHISYGLYNERFDTPFLSTNDIVYRMLGVNKNFYKTKYYERFLKDIHDSYMTNLRHGKIMVIGNYSTICGNPIEMLLMSIGEFNGKQYIKRNTVHTTRFEDGETILGSRSPHVCAGCILITKNKRYDLIDKYMNATDEIIYINSINENILFKLSGADFDSDTVLITNNKLLVEAAKKNTDKFLVSTNNVHAKKIKRKYTNYDKYDLDYKTSKNLIGEIVNLSQILNSVMWDRINNGSSLDNEEEIINDINQLNVMSGIEIDSAKKEFDINNSKELKFLRNKYFPQNNDKNFNTKPYFFYGILKRKSLLNDKMKFKLLNTSMDYLNEYLDSISRKKKYRFNHRKEFVSMYDFLKTENYSYDSVNRRHIKSITSLLKQYDDEIRQIYTNPVSSSSYKYKISQITKYHYIDRINKFKMNHHTMIYLLKSLDKENNDSIYKRCFSFLFCEENSRFMKLIRKSKEPIERLKKDKNGNITLFGIRYKICDK